MAIGGLNGAGPTAGLRPFAYRAVDAEGGKVSGAMPADSEEMVFAHLRQNGLTPLRITEGEAIGRRASGLSDRLGAELLSDVAALLRAGADFRAALQIIRSKPGDPRIKAACGELLAQVSSGADLEGAFARHFSGRRTFVQALVAAGEMSGDLPGAFERAAEMMESRIRIRDQLVSTLSYPAFVLASALIALGVILLLVIPSLAPLVEDAGGQPPFLMAALIALSDGLHANALMILGLTGLSAVGLTLLGRLGLLSAPLDRLMLDGPFRGTVGPLLYGGFAMVLGNILTSGAPIADALRMAIRSVPSAVARRRLEAAAQSVREGEALSSALEAMPGFPKGITRLTAIGEASGSAGAMLLRSGKLEEAAALRRIERGGAVIGPVLIVALGLVIGLMMAGLLSGITGIGEAVLK